MRMCLGGVQSQWRVPGRGFFSMSIISGDLLFHSRIAMKIFHKFSVCNHCLLSQSTTARWCSVLKKSWRTRFRNSNQLAWKDLYIYIAPIQHLWLSAEGWWKDDTGIADASILTLVHISSVSNVKADRLSGLQVCGNTGYYSSWQSVQYCVLPKSVLLVFHLTLFAAGTGFFLSLVYCVILLNKYNSKCGLNILVLLWITCIEVYSVLPRWTKNLQCRMAPYLICHFKIYHKMQRKM